MMTLRYWKRKSLLYPFSSGVVVIKHWKIHNYIQSDRYTPTKYQKEKINAKKSMEKAHIVSLETKWIHNVYKMDTQWIHRLG